MICRALALLTVLGYIAGQLAAAPHAHGSAPENHDARPHFHLSGYGGDHHDHHGEQSDQRGAHGDQSSHDDDAVYLQVVVPGSPDAGPHRIDLLRCSMLHWWVASTAAAPSPAIALTTAWYEPRPNATGEHCALFLTLQSLRI